MNIEELKKNRDQQVHGLFTLMIQIAFIFAVPAIIAALSGKYLDKDGSDFYTVIFLVIAFVLSWIMVIFVYKRKTKKLTEVENLIKEAQKQNV